MWKLGMVAVVAGVWTLAGPALAPGQMTTETRLEGVSIQAAPTQASPVAVETRPALEPLRDPLDQRRREQEALLDAERLQRQAETQRISAIRRGVMAITQDENLADVMAHSTLTLTELEELLNRYDWSANLEAEQLRARRMQETMRQAASRDYWSGEAVEVREFPLQGVSQRGDMVAGYVENKSQQAHERFKMEAVLRTADGSESLVESEYVEQFEVGERRLIRFKAPWSDKTVTNVRLTGSRSFFRPAAQ